MGKTTGQRKITNFPKYTFCLAQKTIHFPQVRPKYESYLWRVGAYDAVQKWVMAHPGERLPRKELAKKFKCYIHSIDRVSAQVEAEYRKLREKHHELGAIPNRVRGGPRAMPPEVIKAISDILSYAAPGSALNVTDVMKEVGRRTGIVPSIKFITRYAKKFKGMVNITVKGTVIGGRDIVTANSVVKALAAKGIIARPFRERLRLTSSK